MSSPRVPRQPAEAAHQDQALASQERLLPFLLNPGSYPHQPRSVRLIQTHASFVVVAPPFIYKVKKAVDFGFLDFSTLEQRHHFCEQEVELNRRLTDGIYLGVVPITHQGRGFRFGGDGTVIEYAVQMRQLAAGYFLDQQVDRHVVQTADLDRVVNRLSAFYQSQHPTARIAAAGQIPRLRTATEENFRQTRAFIGQTLSEAALGAIRMFTETSYRTLRSRFAARVRELRIRDCHGDLHLEHIHLTPRTLNIYDCIEFNERFRHVDIANDVAFLAMDLDFHGRRDLSGHVVQRMARELADPGLLDLMNFYQCYRAYVRGKVESLHSVAHAASTTERADGARLASRYFRLALNYAVAGSRPLVLAVMGPPGSGKSTVAHRLGGELGWTTISSDRVRKEQAGVPAGVRGDAAERRRLYSASRTEATYRTLRETAAEACRQGNSILLDATFGRERHRTALLRQCARLGVDCCFIELQASRRALRTRLRAREHESAQDSDARLEDFDTVLRSFSTPREIPRASRLRIPTDLPLTETVTLALSGLARRQATMAPGKPSTGASPSMR